MNTAFGISTVVHIRNHSVFLNDECVFSAVADPDNFLKLAYTQTGAVYPKFYKMDRLSKYGFLAAEWLMKEKQTDDLPQYKKGIVLQNHSASLDTDRNYQASIATIPSPAIFVYTLPNIVMGEMAIRHGFKGENAFFVEEKFNASNLAGYVKLLLLDNILSTAIIGYIELNDMNPDVFLCLVEENGSLPLDADTLGRLYNRHHQNVVVTN